MGEAGDDEGEGEKEMYKIFKSSGKTQRGHRKREGKSRKV